MKRLLTFIAIATITLTHGATPNPYHRVDTVKYKGFTSNATLYGHFSSRL